jgi:ribosomal protein S21
MSISVSQNETIDSALRRLQRQTMAEELIETLQERSKFRTKQLKRASINKEIYKRKRKRAASKRIRPNKGKPRR